MSSQSWVVHVAHLLVSRSGHRVRNVVAKLPSPGLRSKISAPATGTAPNVVDDLSVPEASQSAAVFAESPVTSAEAAAPNVVAQTADQTLDDSERTANTIGAEVAGTYGAHTGAADDPNVVTSGPTGSESVFPVEPDTPADTNTSDPQAGRWLVSETLTFTPDDSLNLVDDIEFTFEPEPNEAMGWVKGDGSRECPEEFPIKGNGTSHIYHLPGQPSYAATKAELCFATEQDAVDNGFRPTKRSRPSQ